MGIPKLQHPDDMDLARFREQGEYQARRTVDVAELKQLIAEGHFDHYSHPYGWDVLLEFYRWIVWSARRLGPTEETRWGTTSAFADVGDYHSCTSFPGPRAFGAKWQTDLVRRLRFALWSDWPLVSEWRRRAKLDPPRKVVLTGPFAKGGRIDLELRTLLGCAHPLKRLSVALNHCHPGARQPVSVSLCPGEDRWNAVLWYGYQFTPYDANWSVECEQVNGEPFAKFLRRASGLFESLMAASDRPVPNAGAVCSGRPRFPVKEDGCGCSTARPLVAMTCSCTTCVPRLPPCPTPIVCVLCGAVWINGHRAPEKKS